MSTTKVLVVRVDRSAIPVYPTWLGRVMHPELEDSGPGELDLINGVELWLCPRQDGGLPKGQAVYDQLEAAGELALCLNLQDALAMQDQLSSEEFHGLFPAKAIFFWASVVQSRKDRLLVPYLCEDGGKVTLLWRQLNHSLLCHTPSGVACLRAFSIQQSAEVVVLFYVYIQLFYLIFYGIKTIQNIKINMDINSKKKKGKVLVMMSGGVDSSVAAALLQKSGFEVEGAFMKNFSPESWQGVLDNDCPWEQDVKDVEAVCSKLGIKWRSFNFEKEYKEKVIEYFFYEYERGRTPNPDVMCNKYIKFGIFLDKAIELGFDYVATGHYIQIKNRKLKTKNVYKLYKNKDEVKDQSYFLWQLNQEQLSRAIFPLGPYSKKEVRELAKEFDLPNSEKKDSQGLCFVGHIKLQDFLGQKLPKKKGQIIEKDGKVLGEHNGAYFYTVGQRKGIGLPQGPYYVAERNVETNTLVVDKNPTDILTKECELGDLNWIAGEEPEFPLVCGVKIRSQGREVAAVLYKTGEGCRLVFDEAQFAVASGQSIVFYKDNEMLGGGIIKN